MSRVEFLYSRSAYGTDYNHMSKQKTVEILHSYGYGTLYDHVSKEKTDEFKYPIVYHTLKDNVVFIWSSRNDRGHFGIPKVIFSNGAACTPFIDYKGEYGMSQFCYAIVDEPDKLPLIQKALMHEVFVNLNTCTWGNTGDKYNPKLIKMLKKDFYLKYI